MPSDRAAFWWRRPSEGTRNLCAVYVDSHRPCCRLSCCSFACLWSTLFRPTRKHHQRVKSSFIGIPVGSWARTKRLG